MTAGLSEWLTVKEVAQWFAVSDTTIHRWISEKKLIALRVEGIVRIQEKAILDFVLEYSTV